MANMQPSTLKNAVPNVDVIIPIPRTASKHVCKIKNDPNVTFMTQLPPFAPFHKRLKRAWRRFTLISDNNTRTHQYFLSNFSIFKEKQRHARTKRFVCIIHPFSNFCRYYEKLMAIVYMIVFITDPFIGAFLAYLLDSDDLMGTLVACSLFVVNIFMYLNAVANFAIGYVINQTKTIVLDPKQIAVHYLKTFFIFDVVAASPIMIIFSRAINDESNLLMMHLTYQLHIFRYPRLITVVMTLSNWMRSCRIRDSVIVLMLITLITVFMLHWWSCLLFTIPSIRFHLNNRIRKTSWTHRALIELGEMGVPYKSYFQAVLVTMSHFFGTGIGMYKTKNKYEWLLLGLLTVIGSFYYLIVIALILQIFGVVNIAEMKYEELKRQVEEYMTIKKIPAGTKKRMLSYYEYKFQRRFFMEQAIMASLSEHLRCEIILHGCKNLIEDVPIFQGAPKSAIGSILGMVKPEVFLPGDRILGVDDLKENLYFIAWGTAAVYIDNRELVHLEDGDYFGDFAEKIALSGENSSYEVYAIEIMELFCIPYEDLIRCLLQYPQILERLRRFSDQKSRFYAKLLETEINISEDILSNLRRGKILEKVKKRI